ncbi:hypothetical protein BASA81_005522 [Batrachochytrium salamandrivorans]|nr:hypothetical protein BASA81_005522 [Batrachochytrium salamandrivorans]
MGKTSSWRTRPHRKISCDTDAFVQPYYKDFAPMSPTPALRQYHSSVYLQFQHLQFHSPPTRFFPVKPPVDDNVEQEQEENVLPKILEACISFRVRSELLGWGKGCPLIALVLAPFVESRTCSEALVRFCCLSRAVSKLPEVLDGVREMASLLEMGSAHPHALVSEEVITNAKANSQHIYQRMWHQDSVFQAVDSLCQARRRLNGKQRAIQRFTRARRRRKA